MDSITYLIAAAVFVVMAVMKSRKRELGSSGVYAMTAAGFFVASGIALIA